MSLHHILLCSCLARLLKAEALSDRLSGDGSARGQGDKQPKRGGEPFVSCHVNNQLGQLLVGLGASECLAGWCVLLGRCGLCKPEVIGMKLMKTQTLVQTMSLSLPRLGNKIPVQKRSPTPFSLP